MIAGVIHVLPSAGVIGAGALHSLYGVDVGDPNVVLLLRHRAALFGVLGAGLVLAAFRPEWQRIALGVGLVSTLSFVALAWVSPAPTPPILRVVYVDIAVAALLTGAIALRLRYPVSRS